MFKNPENLLFLLGAAVWLLLLMRHLWGDILARRERFASAPLLPRIVGHPPTRRPLGKWALLFLGFVCMGVGLARPIGDVVEENVQGSGLDLVIALDLSNSMQVADIESYSRLQVAKALLQKLAQSLLNDRVGLVVFAGESMVQCPLTLDRGTFMTFLDRVDPSLMAKQGTDLAGAIETCLDRFDFSASQSKAIVLVSDGEDPDQKRLERAIGEASRKGVPVFAVGIGSSEGGPIPVGRNVWGDLQYRVYQGRRVVSRLDDRNLKQIAKGSGGEFWRASDEKSARNVAAALGGLKRVAMNRGTRLVASELFFWPILAAFFLLLGEWMISERIPYAREKDHWLKRI